MSILLSLPSDLSISVLCDWSQVGDVRSLDATFILSNAKSEILDIFEHPNFCLCGNGNESKLIWICRRGLSIKKLFLDISVCFEKSYLILLVNPTKINELVLNSNRFSRNPMEFDSDIKDLIVKKINEMESLLTIEVQSYSLHWWDPILSRILPKIWQQLTKFDNCDNNAFSIKHIAKMVEHCVNLTNLHIELDIPECDVRKIIQKNQKLSALFLNCSHVSKDVMNDIATHLNELKSLEIYEAAAMIPLSAITKILKNNKKLYEFAFRDVKRHYFLLTTSQECQNNQPDKSLELMCESGNDIFHTDKDLFDFFSENVDFNTIRCDYFLTFSRRVMDTIATNNVNLRDVMVGNRENLLNAAGSYYVLGQMMSKFPKLDFLTLNGTYAIRNCDLINLFNMKNNLTKLYICYNRTITEATLLKMIECSAMMNFVCCYACLALEEATLTVAMETYCAANNRVIQLSFLEEGWDVNE